MMYDYKKVPSSDCPDTDIKLVNGDVKACIRECDTIDRCVGFVYSYHRAVMKHNCLLKYKCITVPAGGALVYLKQSFQTHQPSQQAISSQAGATVHKTQPEANSIGDQKQNHKKDNYDYDFFQK